MLFLCRGFISFFSRLFIVLWSLAILRPFFIFCLSPRRSLLLRGGRLLFLGRSLRGRCCSLPLPGCEDCCPSELGCGRFGRLPFSRCGRSGRFPPSRCGRFPFSCCERLPFSCCGRFTLPSPSCCGRLFFFFSCYGFHLHLLLCPLFGGGHGQNGSDFPALQGQPVSWVLVYVLLPINYPV